MNQVSSSLAATHDGWFREPAIKRVDVVLHLWWRHLQRRQPFLVDLLEWTMAAGLALTLITAELIITA
jgi:hypothetical protein